MTNLFRIPDFSPTEPELEERILSGSDGLRVMRIVSAGHSSPEGFWYDQEDDEWVTVLEGTGRILFDNGEEIVLTRGETLLIPRHARHRVTGTSAPCIWLAIFARNLASEARTPKVIY